jgi:RHS repeat-associated protein
LHIQVNNGAVNNVAYSSGVFHGNLAFAIGGRSDGVATFNGRIDEVGFWKRVLSPAEISALYNAGVGCQYPFSGCKGETYVYDGDGNRVKSTVSGVTTTYIGNYYEWNGSAGVKYYYANGNRVAMRDAAGTLYFLINDHLGSTTAVADASGNLYGQDMYYPWGNIRYTSGTVPASYTFAGSQLESGISVLLLMGSRWYDTLTDRFLSADTILPGLNQQSLNRYSYALNNPLKYTDPSGHWPCGGFIGSALGFLGFGSCPADPGSNVISDPICTGCAAKPEVTGPCTDCAAKPEVIGPCTDCAAQQETITPCELCGAQVYADPPAEGFGSTVYAARRPGQINNDIGNWGANQVGQNLPVDVGQFPVTWNGVNRRYDGRLTGTEDNYVEIKTSVWSETGLSSHLKKEVAFDAEMDPKPLWIFVNGEPQKGVRNLLRDNHIPWHQLHVPYDDET